MKFLESKYYRPRTIATETHIDGQYHLTTQKLDERLKADSNPFEELIDSMMASIKFHGTEVVIKRSHLAEFVQCTDFHVVRYDRQTGQFFTHELCYYHPEYEFFLLLSEDLSNDYDKTIIELGYYSVLRLAYDSSQADTMTRIRAFYDAYLEKYVSSEAKISLLLKEGQDLVFKSHTIKPLALDLATMYNDDFLPVHHKIKNSLSNDNKGLVLLHGISGSGKTNYIKWLTAQIPDKNFIFVPNNLIGALAEPQFMSMLIDNKNSVLVLEDCENYIAERVGGGNTSDVVSTILNIADGILSDVLECQFICTFNADLTDIDHALLRRGRLIAQYQFTPLTVDKSNRYLASQNKDITVDKPMTLAHLSNIQEAEFKVASTQKGFGFIN